MSTEAVNTKKRARLRSMAAPMAALIALLALTGCGGDVPKEQVDTSQQAGLAKNVKVISVQGDTRSVTPSDIAIICVEGSAFLYINKDVAYTGNPTLARFTEQDAKCKGA